MALGKAIVAGVAAALVAPQVTHDDPRAWAQMLRIGAVHVDAGGRVVYWSWPVFCVVTLVLFLLLRAVENR